MPDITTDKLYINTGKNNPLNLIINVFGRVYLHTLAAGQGRDCQTIPFFLD